MDSIIPVLGSVVVLAAIVVVAMLIRGRTKKERPVINPAVTTPRAANKRSKDQKNIITSAHKKLTQNPRDPGALNIVADAYFQDESWDKAYTTYKILLELAEQGPHDSVNEFEIQKRYGLSALKCNLEEEAYRGLQSARNLRQDNFEVNYNLGAMEFKKNNYEKAITLLQSARAIEREHAPTLRCLGHSLFKMSKYKEAMAFIRRAIELAPDDKESLYVLGECYYEAGQSDQAIKIFAHLRADPAIGADACYFSGTINISNNQFDKALEDFEIGLKHETIKPEIKTDMKYQLAVTYLKLNNINKALNLLKQIQSEHSAYKDVVTLINKYQELNANKNLQIFLLAPSADFITLCRRVVTNYFVRARVKITDVSLNMNEWADILAEIDTPKWSDAVMFRFIRTTGAVGEMIVRDFHSHLKDVKAGRGICITVGTFTDEAKRFTEARLIDLIEKDRLAYILKAMDSRLAAAKK
jgi:tetratricopeptide (TPR) repeat protein